MPKTNIIQPQKGFQEKFVRSNVDFAVGGGVLNSIPVDRFVATPKGFVRMGDIKAGDIIINPYGGTQKVNFVVDKGEKECVEFILDDGRVVESDLEHNWRIKYREYPIQDVTANHIINILEKNKNIESRHRKAVRIPLTKPVVFENDFTDDDRPIHPYVLGCLIGDGWFTEKSHSIGFYKQDKEIIDRMIACGCPLKAEKKREHYYTFADDSIENGLRKIGLWDRRSYDKFIPDAYKYASIEDRMELIRGLMDTDGTSSIRDKKYRVGFRTVSPHLRDDMREMLWSIGAKVSICTTKACVRKRKENSDKTMNCRESYGFYIVAQDNRELFHLTRKKAKCQDDSQRKVKAMLTIKDYKLTGKKHCKCINVSDENHTFLTDNYVITKNCGKTFSAVMSVAEPSEDPKFRALFLRNNLGDARASGGILDTFAECYGAGVKIVESGEPRVTFPSGAKCDVTHVSDQSYDKVMQRFKGRQFDFIYFDEGTGFTWECFTAIYTRNRGKGKWTGKVRMTTNPERDHWLRTFLDWYIGPDGYIRKDRDGKIRYFYMAGPTVKDVVWGNSKEEVYMQCKPDIDAKLKSMNEEEKEGFFTWKDIIQSFTFYLGKMSENKASIGNNPGYIGAVAMTGGAVSKQLLEGNWNVSTKHDGDAPIKLENINKVLQNDPQRNGDRWVTCDLADTGTDNFIALAWDGFHIEDILILSKSTPKMNADYLRMFAAEHDVPGNHIIYDAVRGTYMNDYIPDATPFVSYRAPIGLYGRMAMKLKDECYMRLAEVIKKDMLSFSDKVANKQYEHQMLKERISVSAEFIEECSVVRFTERSSGKKSLLTKKEMNAKLGKSRSMDLLDPCAMRMLPVLQYPYGEELFRTSKAILDMEDDETSDNLVDVYDESNWY